MNAATHTTENYTILLRAEGKNFSMDDIRSQDFTAAAGLSLQEVLEAAHAAKVIGTGSARSGAFEVQCDRGIWATTNSRRIDLSTATKAARVRFASWDSMEADEVAGGTGLAVDCGEAVESTGRVWWSRDRESHTLTDGDSQVQFIPVGGAVVVVEGRDRRVLSTQAARELWVDLRADGWTR